MDKELQLNYNRPKNLPFFNEQRIWKDVCPNNLYKWPINAWEYIQHHESLGKCKSSVWDVTSCPSGRWLSIYQTIISVAKDVKLEPMYTIGGNIKSWKTIWSFLQNINNRIIILSSTPPSGVHPKEFKAESQRVVCTVMHILHCTGQKRWGAAIILYGGGRGVKVTVYTALIPGPV